MARAVRGGGGGGGAGDQSMSANNYIFAYTVHAGKRLNTQNFILCWLNYHDLRGKTSTMTTMIDICFISTMQFVRRRKKL